MKNGKRRRNLPAFPTLSSKEMEAAEFVPPELSEGENYHVFCSYSSTDYEWTHSLIQQLEDTGLKVCDQERDFTRGRPFLENMSESIHQSQKVLLVLSAEFVGGSQGLLKANMSMFKDCLQRKPIVPVLLEKDLSIPLSLAHLTYLDVQLPDFRQQLLRVLCKPNQDLQSSTVVPYQEASLYNGKILEPVPAVEHVNKFDCGVWSDSVPDQLSQVIQQPQRYREAIGIINTVAQTKKEMHRVVRELQKAVGQANTLLFEEHILLGAQSNSKLLLVYVSVESCRQELCALSEDQDFFHAAIQEYSCEYTCSLAKGFCLTKQPPLLSLLSDHLERGVCFCQQMESAEFVPPELSEGENYHVFCSYSSTDYEWTHSLIQQLEDTGLKVCDHERDFISGRPILENMSESIHQSQKVLLVLSAEFVRSRWCLLEANMSMFKDCLQRKPIVPVLLQRDLPIPLHLAHLTYLDVQLPDFRQQLLRVLCKPNQDLQSSTVVPYQPPSLYNGKCLQPLFAVNEEQLYQLTVESGARVFLTS
ncbi:hypothetical protein WMY93_011834 [Mugilogobius chulae]|uniref:TIR domain-containing protein n=1 Tax=Mugilogobius chulae TaxID=88201 RepID=A0AAW0PFW7_9GOBI